MERILRTRPKDADMARWLGCDRTVLLKGTLTERERASYRYDAIVTVRVLREARRQTFEFRLTADDLITVRVRDAYPPG